MADDADAADSLSQLPEPAQSSDSQATPDLSTAAPEPDNADGVPNACPSTSTKPRARTALILGTTTLAALGGLGGWLGYQDYRHQRVEHQHELFVQIARQGALNLTTIDYTRVDSDIKRILDSATGIFYDDFQKRSAAFTEVVRKFQSKTQGNVTEAGLESVSGDSAQVLVTVSVNTSDLSANDQQPRLWRMRIDVQKIGDGVKVSNVGFVP